MSVIQLRHVDRDYRIWRRDADQSALAGLFRREYATIHAICQLSLDIDNGESVGYLGLNGSGKSTTIKMLSGILAPTSGQVEVLGMRPVAQRQALAKKIGVVFGQRSRMWWDLTVGDSMRLFASMHRIGRNRLDQTRRRFDDVLEIGALIGTPVRKLSLGEKMRCELFIAMLHRPQLLLLDEPAIGVDILTRRRITEYLKEVNREFGATLLFASHTMDDVEAVCRRIVVIDRGRLVFDGSLDRLRQLYGGTRTIRMRFRGGVPGRLPDGAAVCGDTGGPVEVSWTVETDRVRHSLGEILAELTPDDVTVSEPSLEQLLTTLYGQAES